jgi:hypothetical protein
MILRSVADKYPAIAGRQLFNRLEGEDREVSQAPNGLPSVGRAKGVSSVLYNLEAAAGGYRTNLRHVAGVPTIMHHQHGLSPKADAPFQISRVKVRARRLDVRENRLSSSIEHGHRCSYEGLGRRDHLVARPNRCTEDSQMQARCSAVQGERPREAKTASEFPLKRLYVPSLAQLACP